MIWRLSYRADPVGNRLAKRHYTCQGPNSAQFVPPGRCIVLLAEDANALWVSSWPYPEFTKHAWAGAWVNSLFRNESRHLSSRLITEAVAITRYFYPPALGMITFIDPEHVSDIPADGKKYRQSKLGWCYRKAGFRPAKCPLHAEEDEACMSCKHMTKDGKFAFQLLPNAMPDPVEPMGAQRSLFVA